MSPKMPQSKGYRTAMILWAAGLIVGIPGQLYAAWVLHNHVEANILFLISLVLYAPLLIMSTVKLRRLRKELHELMLEAKMHEIALHTFLALMDPEEHKRLHEIQDISKMFNGKEGPKE